MNIRPYLHTFVGGIFVFVVVYAIELTMGTAKGILYYLGLGVAYSATMSILLNYMKKRQK